MGFSQSANVDGCPTCGRAECRKCFTSVGQILGATGDLLPAALAHIDSIIQAFRYLEEKAKHQDDSLALRIAGQGKVSARTLLRNATGLDNLLRVLAVCAVIGAAFRGDERRIPGVLERSRSLCGQGVSKCRKRGTPLITGGITLRSTP
jgi:hypothetical protein